MQVLVVVAVAVGLLAITLVGVLSRPFSTERVLLTRPSPIAGAVPASAAGQDVLGVAENGCVTVGAMFLVAPFGSELHDGGRTVRLEGIGSFRIGERLPVMGGVVTDPLRGATLPAAYKQCGPGVYESVWGDPPR